jgi:hypothetical protein
VWRDLETGETKDLTNGDAVAIWPDIHGNVVVWQDYRHCPDPQQEELWSCAEIHGYNLETQVEARITDLQGWPKSNPRIWGNRVFVDMNPPNIEDIVSALFMIELPEELR